MSEIIKEVTAINQNSPKGQITTGIQITYGFAVKPESVHVDTYQVDDRMIDSVSVNGADVLLRMNPNDPVAMTREMIGTGPETKTKVTGARIILKQVKSIEKMEDSSRVEIDGTIPLSREFCPVVDEFKRYSFYDKYGRELIYYLFIPEHKEGEKLPLVLFMHDSSVCSLDAGAPLLQGMGGIIWAVPEEQKKRPCYVLVPQYPDKTAFDDFTVTWECEATAELVEKLTGSEDIDSSRIYATGQSMGCMMLCELNCNHPKLFTACFLVAGQWNPQKMVKLKDKKLWILVSEKDAKAYPIMTDSIHRIEEAGGHVARGHLLATADVEAQRIFAEQVLNQGAEIQFTWYEGTSVLPTGTEDTPGNCHLSTWLWAYSIEPIREWLFRQREKTVL